MSTTAKSTQEVHMIVRTGERICDHCGSVLSTRGPETLLCGGEIVGATSNDAGNVVDYQLNDEGKMEETGLAPGAKIGTRLTSDPGDVTCKTCERLLKEAP